MLDIGSVKKNGFPPEEAVLSNKKTGEAKRFILRTFRPGDEEGIISCVRQEHKNTYFKKFFYDPSELRKAALSNEYLFFAAEYEGNIAGIELLRFFTSYDDDYIEPASQIVASAYRGYGLAEALVEYTFRIAVSFRPSALFVHAAMYHSITQRVCENQGMRPVGFEIASFLTSSMINSYNMADIKKYSAGTLVLPVEKRKAGTVYLHREIAGYCEERYKELGAEYDIRSSPFADPGPDMEPDSSAGAAPDINKGSAHALLEVIRTNEVNRYVVINVRRYGDDMLRRIKDEMKETEDFIHNPRLYTYLAVLPVSGPYAFKAYEELRSIGFFFAGLQALCGTEEKIFMYWVGDLELKMEDYVVTEGFSRVREGINRFYLERNKKQGEILHEG